MKRCDTQLVILARAAQHPEGHVFPFGTHQIDPIPDAKLLLKAGLLKRVKTRG